MLKNILIGILAVLAIAAFTTIGIREIQFRQAKIELTAELASTKSEFQETQIIALRSELTEMRVLANMGTYLMDIHQWGGMRTLIALREVIRGEGEAEFAFSADGNSMAVRIPIIEESLYYHTFSGTQSAELIKDAGSPKLIYMDDMGRVIIPSYR